MAEMMYPRKLVRLIIMLVLSLNVESCELSYSFYKTSCPQIDQLVRAALQPIFVTDPSAPAGLLRLMFHDCQVQGCDASILTDPGVENMSPEMGSSKNLGIRKREVIGMVKSFVETECPEQLVSCADLVILAAREAVAVSGGPFIEVPLGRRDSAWVTTSQNADAHLPSSTAGVDTLLLLFTHKGMSLEESVAILGAHTLGITHCSNVLARLNKLERKESKAKVDSEFVKILKLKCQIDQFLGSNSSFVVNDPTAVTFDNTYYVNALGGHGVLQIDAEMAMDPRTGPIVKEFSMNQERFYQAFSSAFVKLSCSGVQTGRQGIIRKQCNEIN